MKPGDRDIFRAYVFEAYAKRVKQVIDSDDCDSKQLIKLTGEYNVLLEFIESETEPLKPSDLG